MSRLTTSSTLLVLLVAASAGGAPCPSAGGAVQAIVVPPAGAALSEMLLSGELRTPSCDDAGELATTYLLEVECDGVAACAFSLDGLAPGDWLHSIQVTGGASAGQAQARRGLAMDRSGGIHEVRWPLFRTVVSVTNLDDSLGCDGCLRQALEQAELAAGPTLIQFAGLMSGSIQLSEVLPPITAADLTIDGIDSEGRLHRRTIDANGMSHAVLRLRSSGNHIIGLRLVNSGGNSDVLIVDGEAANDNRIESVQIVGRAQELCQLRGQLGCRVDRRCIIANRQAPLGNCGDDGIAVRDNAGIAGANALVDVDVTGAFDKGIKISEGGVAWIERSRIYGNADGGIQATLGGTLTAVENRAEDNRGTTSANGLAANGPPVGGEQPSIVVSRGNLILRNELRGVSVRSLSQATLRDDFVCGNGANDLGTGFGLAVLDAAGLSSFANVRGVALVNNILGGVATVGNSIVHLGDERSPGFNAFAFNGFPGAGRTDLQNLSSQPVAAIGNHWDLCGPGYRCSEIAVQMGAIEAPLAPVDLAPARPTALLRAPIIDEIRPNFAAAGDLVWIYGREFDAIGGAAEQRDCAGVGRPCHPSDANCVFVGREPAEVIAATPTVLVIRAPFTCVEPVQLAARTRRSRGFGKTTFCTVKSANAAAANAR